MAINWNVNTYAQLSSTQDYIKELGAEGLPEGTLVQAMMQKNGRGRHGKDWNSPIGNLYMSFLLRPDCSANEAGQISFVAAVALSAAMDDYLEEGHAKTLKWPNDIFIDDKKCAGILLESELSSKGKVAWLALGMGVNIMAPPEDAICLQDVSWKIQVPVHPFRDKLLETFNHYYSLWQQEGFSTIRKLWLAQAHGLGQDIKVRLPDRELTGTFTDLDKSGALLLSKADGSRQKIHAGEVYFQ